MEQETDSDVHGMDEYDVIAGHQFIDAMCLIDHRYHRQFREFIKIIETQIFKHPTRPFIYLIHDGKIDLYEHHEGTRFLEYRETVASAVYEFIDGSLQIIDGDK